MGWNGASQDKSYMRNSYIQLIYFIYLLVLFFFYVDDNMFK